MPTRYTIDTFVALLYQGRLDDGATHGGASSYKSNARTTLLAALPPDPTRFLVIGATDAAHNALLMQVDAWLRLGGGELQKNPKAALLDGFRRLQPGDQIIAGTVKVRKSRPGRAPGAGPALVQPVVPPPTPVAMGAAAVLLHPVTIDVGYILAQFKGRLASQERYYPSLGGQPLRFPAILFRHSEAPAALHRAFIDGCKTAADAVTFFVTAAPEGQPIGTPVELRPAHLTGLRVEPLPDGTAIVRVLAKAPAAAAVPPVTTLVQRTHRTGAEPFERLIFPAALVSQIAAQAPSNPNRQKELFFRHISLDHVVPFADLLLRELPNLRGLPQLTQLIAAQANHAPNQPNVRYFKGQREDYKTLSANLGALTPDLQQALAADLRLLNSHVQLEILSTSSNSRRGRGVRP